MHYFVNLIYSVSTKATSLLQTKIHSRYTVLLFFLRHKGTWEEKGLPTSWYFLVTLLGTHWHSLQLWRQQAQFPPQRLTRRQPGQKMVSVLFSSSLMDTEKLRGVQLYSLTSSFRRFRSTTAGHKRKQRKITYSCPEPEFISSRSFQRGIYFTNNMPSKIPSYFNEVGGLRSSQVGLSFHSPQSFIMTYWPLKRCHCAILRTKPTKQLRAINRKLNREKEGYTF